MKRRSPYGPPPDDDPILEPPIVRTLRLILQQELPHARAAAVLFEALAAWQGRVPNDTEEAIEVVREALPGVLELRAGLDAKRARELAKEIERMLHISDAPTGGFRAVPEQGAPSRTTEEIDIDVLEPIEEPSKAEPLPLVLQRHTAAFVEKSTAHMPVTEGPVPVVVLSSSTDFAARLQMALGPEHVSARAARGVENLQTRGFRGAPDVVIVDANDFAPIEGRILIEALAALPSITSRTIWGCETAYGQRVVSALERQSVPCIPVQSGSGIEPIADLIRARRA